jgi:IS30 family transposase
LVHELSCDFPVAVACRVLNISTSGYYEWRSRRPSEGDLDDAHLIDQIRVLHAAARGTYGVRRVHAELVLGRRLRIGHGRIERLMRLAGLQGVHHRKWRYSGSGRLPAVFEDRVKRVFSADAPDKLWVMDITQHRTSEGWVGGFNWSSQHLDHGGVRWRVRGGRFRGGGARRQWAADRALRAPMRSPGRPEPSRAVQRDFWRQIASGVTTVEASEAVGVSSPVGIRWFRHAGGMPPLSLGEPSGRYLLFAEREEIALLRAQKYGVREIARRIGRNPGTVSRELRRNAATRSGKQEYRALVAQWKAQQAAKRPKTAKLVHNPRLREYVQDRLAGSVHRPDGSVVAGPETPAWKGLNKPHRQDRRWAIAWSPEQISWRLKVDFPDDESMRISHEAIYQSLFIQGRGALRRELVTCLRTGRALREPRARSRSKPQGHVTPAVVLSERPAEADDRAVPGHWEGDLIIGTGRSAIGTLVERSSRTTLLVHLPRLEGWGEMPRVKNGPSLGGYGAVAMNAGLTATMTKLPEQLRKTLTWDRGKELSGHAQFALDTGTTVFFADPHSPWQRPTNENTNGLLRQYFPKGTDLSRWSAEDLEGVALALNNRPRKSLDWKTPAEVFDEQIRSLKQTGVATTS